MLRATALAIALALAPVTLPAATILADFESGAPAAKPMEVAAIGTGARFAGSTRALCGGDVDVSLRFDGLDFDRIDSIALDVGAAAVGDRFDWRGKSGDYIRIFGGDTLLAEFRGQGYGLRSTSRGQRPGAGTSIGSTLQTITLPDIRDLALGTSSFTIEMRSTGPDEHYAVDNIRYEPSAIPLPATLPLLLGGAAALVWLRRRASA